MVWKESLEDGKSFVRIKSPRNPNGGWACKREGSARVLLHLGVSRVWVEWMKEENEKDKRSFTLSEMGPTLLKARNATCGPRMEMTGKTKLLDKISTFQKVCFWEILKLWNFGYRFGVKRLFYPFPWKTWFLGLDWNLIKHESWYKR